jgi:hypothetical protein
LQVFQSATIILGIHWHMQYSETVVWHATEDNIHFQTCCLKTRLRWMKPPQIQSLKATSNMFIRFRHTDRLQMVAVWGVNILVDAVAHDIIRNIYTYIYM